MATQEEINDTIATKAMTDGQFAIAFAILQLVDTQERNADAQESVAEALDKIGREDGPLEVAAAAHETIAEALDRIGRDDGMLEFVGAAIREGLDRVAEAIKNHD